MAIPTPGGISPQPMAPPTAEATPVIEHHESPPAPEGFVLTSPMLAAREALTESKLEKAATKSRVLSLVIAAAVHGVVIALVGLVVVANYDRDAPEIIAVPGDATIADDVQVKTLQPVQQQKPSASSSHVSQIISSTAASPIAVPVIEDILNDDVLDFSASLSDNIGSNPFGGEGNFASFLPPALSSRCTHKDRETRLAESGGKPEAEEAVVNGLTWIKPHQNNHGSFGEQYKAGMTGLALLAYLGHCETPDSSEFGDSCLEAILWLVEEGIKQKGRLGKSDRHGTYEHAIGAYALAEAYSITRFGKRKIPRIREVLELAIPIIISGQQKNGSWDYGYKSFEQSQRWDISVAGWQIQALKAAQHTKLDFPGINSAMDLAIDHLRKNQDSDNGSFPYSTKGSGKGSASLAGAGALCIILGTGNPKDRDARKAVKFIIDKTKFDWNASKGGAESIYSWYYATQACFQVGGSAWREWNRGFQKVLLAKQSKSGSWEPDGIEGQSKGAATSYGAKADSELYRTLLACLMLEVYYRYLPATETDAPKDF